MTGEVRPEEVMATADRAVAFLHRQENRVIQQLMQVSKPRHDSAACSGVEAANVASLW